MGTSKVQSFLTHLALEEHISTLTQNQALSGLLFIDRHVLDLGLGSIDSVRAKPSQHVPICSAGRFQGGHFRDYTSRPSRPSSP